MRRYLSSLALALALVLGVTTLSAQPAEARRSGVVAGVVVGALIGGLIASEIYRNKRKRYYQQQYYGYGYQPSYYYAPRHHYRHRYYY